MYNQVFDLYHAIFRIVNILNSMQDMGPLSLESVRIWDYYMLFPTKTYDIRLSKQTIDLRKYRKKYINEKNNPYDSPLSGGKLLERMRPYQISALTYLASYGIIDIDMWKNQEIIIVNKDKIEDLLRKFDKLSAQETNVLSWLHMFSKTYAVYGKQGIKSRTGLLISKYDGC